MEIFSIPHRVGFDAGILSLPIQAHILDDWFDRGKTLLNEKCRVSTTSQDAAFISREGFVLEAIDPAKMLVEGIITQKKTQQKCRAKDHAKI